MSVHVEIDLDFQHTGRAICSHLIDGWLVDPGPGSALPVLVDALRGVELKGVLLTHIHLDHAGGTGELLRELGPMPVYVHEQGARHIVDPSRLLASATRLYGDQMDTLWGTIIPVPEEHVRVLSEDVAPPGFRWQYTPGHAVHHASYLHEGTGIAFCGDVAGVRIGDGPVMPPTPPPDIDVELWHRSLELIADWKPSAVALTHFSTFTDVDAHLAKVGAELDALAGLARDSSEQEFEAAIRERLGDVSETAGYLKAMPPETLYSGLARYWSKRDNA